MLFDWVATEQDREECREEGRGEQDCANSYPDLHMGHVVPTYS